MFAAMTLELSDAEARQLDEALRLHLAELMAELARTDDRCYRMGLRDSYDRLSALKARLDSILSDPLSVPDRL